jgi:anhydro-N-acetylmuramic acid kinase
MSATKTFQYLGLMSGTSCDGLDIAWVELSADEPTPKLRAFKTYPYSHILRFKLLGYQGTHQQSSLEQLNELDRQLGEQFGQWVNQFIGEHSIQHSQIRAIGSHGHTLYHNPERGLSRQIAHAAWIAALTGIDTVADFRNADVARGGQGAPLVPIFHKALYQSMAPLALLNIGGIANLSLIQSQGQVSGFDTGPGNVLIDQVCRDYFDCNYDQDGRMGQRGQVNYKLLETMLKDPYFKRSLPKSTGKEYFNKHWLNRFKPESYRPEDLIATLTQLTATSIAISLKQEVGKGTRLVIFGGGSHNTLLISMLQQALGHSYRLEKSDALGISPDAMEAVAFAWLAHCHLEKIRLPLKDITGARKSAVLGAYFPA